MNTNYSQAGLLKLEEFHLIPLKTDNFNEMKESIGTCRDCPLRVSDHSDSREAFIVPWQIDQSQDEPGFSGRNSPDHSFHISERSMF
jgi:hypothetical protein